MSVLGRINLVGLTPENCQTSPNDHLWTATTILTSRLPHLEYKETSEHRPPVNSAAVTILGSQGWSLYSGLTVLKAKQY
jgi:hypothetical protein